MKIAFTHNLRLTDAEEEAEFDTPETIEAITTALGKGGHEVLKIEVSGPASHLASRLEAFSPDLIFNIAEGRRGRAREAELVIHASAGVDQYRGGERRFFRKEGIDRLGAIVFKYREVLFAEPVRVLSLRVGNDQVHHDKIRMQPYSVIVALLLLIRFGLFILVAR